MAVSSISPSAAAASDGGSESAAARQAAGSEIDCSAVHQALGGSSYSGGRSPKFVEHVVVATVAPLVEGGLLEDVVQELNAAMELPGVLATHVGRCEPMLGGEHTFMVHIRAVDSDSCEAAYMAASAVYAKHVTLPRNHRMRTLAEGDAIVVDFFSDVVGAWDAKWPAIRIAVLRFKRDAPEERKEGLLNVLTRLPTLFPSVKQVSWGRNVANERRSYAGPCGYADADLGVILGFSSPHDMYALGDDPKYWELLNYHGISNLEQYQALTLCVM